MIEINYIQPKIAISHHTIPGALFLNQSYIAKVRLFYGFALYIIAAIVIEL